MLELFYYIDVVFCVQQVFRYYLFSCMSQFVCVVILYSVNKENICLYFLCFIFVQVVFIFIVFDSILVYILTKFLFIYF